MGKHKRNDKKECKKKHRKRRSSSSESDSDGSSSGWEEAPRHREESRKKRGRKDSSSSEASSTTGAPASFREDTRPAKQKDAGRGSTSRREAEQGDRSTNQPPPESNDWLGDSDIFSSMAKDYRQEKRDRHLERKQTERRVNLDQPGQHERELNPYWKDGGVGVPENEANAAGRQSAAGPSASRSLPMAESGQGQLQWLQRALKRLREEARDKGLPLEEVAKERWGTLSKLENLIREAESKAGIVGRDRDLGRNRTERRTDELSDRRRHQDGYPREREDTRRRMRRPNSDDEDEPRTPLARGFARPRDFSGDESDGRMRSSDRISRTGSADHRSSRVHHRDHRKDGERRSWRKDQSRRSSSHERVGKAEPEDRRTEGRKLERPDEDRRRLDTKLSAEPHDPHVEGDSPPNTSQQTAEGGNQQADEAVKVLSDTELNKLAAKLLKAEMMGNTEQADKLRKKIEVARKLREENPDAAKGDVRQQQQQRHEVVVLTKTDSRGVSRPVQPVPDDNGGPSDARRRKKIKADTHSGGERKRYFADDDRQSLNEMFEREKLSTAADDVAMFAKMAGRIRVKQGDEDYTVDDAFVEQAARRDDSKGQKERDANSAIREHHAMRKTLDTCYHCLESPACLKHLIISVGSRVALSLPAYQSLTEGHCILSPVEHTTALTLADEDVWQEIMAFRKALTAMFMAADQDCVFFETAMNLSSSRKPHTVVHCVPVPREIGELLPMYYKKAILESEKEWAQNKKLVDLSVKKGLRYSIPKGLPYFAVDFGTDHGFAHVIEDEKEFPRYFGLEIVGGLLDCEPRLWLKKRNENFQEQSRKAVTFCKMWSSYEFNERRV